MALPLIALLRSVAPKAAVQLVGKALNHLLAQQPDLAARLAAHEGKLILIGLDLEQVSPLGRLVMPKPELRLRVTAQGTLKPDRGEADAQLLIKPSLKAGADVATGGTKNLAEHLRTEGDAALAGLLSELIQDLQWDAQSDLNRAVGKVSDIGKQAANRAAQIVASKTGDSDSPLLNRDNLKQLRGKLGELRKRFGGRDPSDKS